MKHKITLSYLGVGGPRVCCSLHYSGLHPDVFAKGARSARAEAVALSPSHYSYEIETTEQVFVAVDDQGDTASGSTAAEARSKHVDLWGDSGDIQIVVFQVKL